MRLFVFHFSVFLLFFFSAEEAKEYFGHLILLLSNFLFCLCLLWSFFNCSMEDPTDCSIVLGIAPLVAEAATKEEKPESKLIGKIHSESNA